MTKTFRQFMRELEKEAGAEGPAAVAEMNAFRAYFRLAGEIAKRRLAKDLSQEQLAKITGIGQSEISHIESGNANPTFRTMYLLANALSAEVRLMDASKRLAGTHASGRSAREMQMEAKFRVRGSRSRRRK